MPVFVPVFLVSLIEQKWCTLLPNNLNRTQEHNKTSETLFFCRNLAFVVKQQKQFLLLGGETKITSWAEYLWSP